MKTNISDSEIVAAFVGKNFGDANHRQLLEQGVLKCLTGFHCGHMLSIIMHDLGLTTMDNKATKKGKLFAMAAFRSDVYAKEPQKPPAVMPTSDVAFQVLAGQRSGYERRKRNEPRNEQICAFARNLLESGISKSALTGAVARDFDWGNTALTTKQIRTILRTGGVLLHAKH